MNVSQAMLPRFLVTEKLLWVGNAWRCHHSPGAGQPFQLPLIARSPVTCSNFSLSPIRSLSSSVSFEEPSSQISKFDVAKAQQRKARKKRAAAAKAPLAKVEPGAETSQPDGSLPGPRPRRDPKIKVIKSMKNWPELDANRPSRSSLQAV